MALESVGVVPRAATRAVWILATALLVASPGASRPASANETGGSKAATSATSGPIRPIDPRRAPTVHLHVLKTGDRYDLRLFDTDGQLRTQALDELRHELRCPRTGVDHPIHWRIVSILVAVAAHYPGRTIQVVSGYRHPKVSRHAKRSNHTRGRAIDFRVEGVPNRELRDLVRASFSGIGVGYYPNSTFIHVDVREREGQWIDYAGPGQDACYSPDVRGDFLSGRAETLSYAQAQARGCKGHTHPSTTTEPVAPSSSDADDEHGGTRVAELDEA